jgi:hypothetical protein
MTNLILVIGPDHDDFHIVKSSSIEKAKKKIKRLWFKGKTDFTDELNFVKVHIVGK